ncbi:PepSY-associated TM helix domain-containing protein [Myroides odoratus]|uniref:PepSY-associated TM helix domain-containing protein n=1 Tax=Myroides odoratus TaxID=256 RepID=UPI0039B02E1A
MNVKNYNRYFHLHTISGIVITVILYIFFFAGSFAFFKNEINSWQTNTPKKKYEATSLQYNLILDSLDQNYGLYGRDLSFRFSEKTRKVGVSISTSKDSLNAKAQERNFGSLDPETQQIQDYNQGYGLGEFLYRLHFFAQVNSLGSIWGWPIGYAIAGFVSFFFLFALITGLLLHWNKIISNFYVFRPWEKFKTVWTDLHTALGVISFPFQLVFALTGSYFLLNYYIVSNGVALLGYNNDTELLNKAIYPPEESDKEVEFSNLPLGYKVDVKAYINQTVARWPDFIITNIQVSDYGDQSMRVTISGKAPSSINFNSRGSVVYTVDSKEVEEISNPYANPGYNYIFSNLMYELHFGSFGGYATRIVYFLVGIAGCVVIISGVLIWLVARDKKAVPERKRKFNFWLANVYMAICLSMYPITALSFIAVKLNPYGGRSFIYSFYFWSWLAVSLVLIWRRSIYKTNRDCLLAGSIIGLMVPVTNYFVTGNWFWVAWKNQYYDILIIDLFWLIVPCITLWGYKLVKAKQEKQEKSEE